MVSKEFAQQLKEELPKLIKDKIITQAQADKISGRYVAEPEESNVVGIISTFGAILIGLGILTFVATNWNQIPSFVRVIFLIAITFGSYWLGYFLKFKKNHAKIGGSILFLGALLFGVSIILISQIYNLHSGTGNWLLIWLIGIIPVAYAFSSTSSLALGIVVFSYWFGIQFARIAATGSSWWGRGSDLDVFLQIFEIWPLTVVVFLAIGIALWAAGKLHETKESIAEFASAYKIAAVFFILFNAYMLTFKIFTNYFWRLNEFQELANVNTVLWVICIIAMLLLGVSMFRNKKKEDLWITLVLASYIIMALLVVTHPGVRERSYDYGYTAPIFTPISLLMNALFICLLVGAAYIGMERKEPYLVNMAIFFFAVDVISRYFEFFYDRLSGAAFFVVTGLILILVAVSLERLRRKLLVSNGA